MDSSHLQRGFEHGSRSGQKKRYGMGYDIFLNEGNPIRLPVLSILSQFQRFPCNGSDKAPVFGKSLFCSCTASFHCWALTRTVFSKLRTSLMALIGCIAGHASHTQVESITCPVSRGPTTRVPLAASKLKAGEEPDSAYKNKSRSAHSNFEKR